VAGKARCRAARGSSSGRRRKGAPIHMQGAVYEVARILVVPGIEDRARGITFRGSRSLYWRIAPARLQDFENAFAIADAPLVPLAPPEATQARNGACQNCRNTNSRPSFRGPALFSKLVACSGRSTKNCGKRVGGSRVDLPEREHPPSRSSFDAENRVIGIDYETSFLVVDRQRPSTIAACRVCCRRGR
jgi:hypothetical protein